MSGIDTADCRRMPVYTTLKVSVIIIIDSVGVKCQRTSALIKAYRSSLNAREAS